MAPTFNSFEDFIERMVIPLRKAHPDWRRLNGDHGSDRTRVAYFTHDRRLFCVHADSVIESLLEPYKFVKSGLPGLALVIGPTASGKREKLKPGKNAGTEKGFYIYQHP
jgi:hypothetical protein